MEKKTPSDDQMSEGVFLLAALFTALVCNFLGMDGAILHEKTDMVAQSNVT